MTGSPPGSAAEIVAPGPLFDIKPAAPGDIDEVLAMIRELADYERLAHLVVADADAIHRALFAPRPVAEALVARETGGNRPAVGFALYFTTFSTFLGKPGLWLEDLFVRPASRGRGIGGALLRRLAATARERDCGRFEWAVLDWNAPAIAVYERMGATLLPDWRIARVTGDALERFGSPAVDPGAAGSDPPAGR